MLDKDAYTMLHTGGLLRLKSICVVPQRNKGWLFAAAFSVAVHGSRTAFLFFDQVSGDPVHEAARKHACDSAVIDHERNSGAKK